MNSMMRLGVLMVHRLLAHAILDFVVEGVSNIGDVLESADIDIDHGGEEADSNVDDGCGGERG